MINDPGTVFRLDGRVAIVTGGSRGLGLAMANALSDAGAAVAICGRNAAHLAAVVEEMKSQGRRVVGIPADVRREAEVQQFVSRVYQEFGRIDVLVNNAGISVRGPIEKIAPADFMGVLETNVLGPWLFSRAVVPHMKRAKAGRIINVASALASVGAPNRTPYGASKGALLQLTRMLAVELAPHGITATALCPGPFRTSIIEDIADTADARDNLVAPVLLKRWGQVDEIKGAVVFLASDAASFITGTAIYVDGGWTAH